MLIQTLKNEQYKLSHSSSFLPVHLPAAAVVVAAAAAVVVVAAAVVE